MRGKLHAGMEDISRSELLLLSFQYKSKFSISQFVKHFQPNYVGLYITFREMLAYVFQIIRSLPVDFVG